MTWCPDKRAANSAEAILPESQHLEVGHVIGEEGFAVWEPGPGGRLVLAFRTRATSIPPS